MSRPPAQRDPGARLLLRPHLRDTEGDIEPGGLHDGERIAIEREVEAHHVEVAAGAVPLPERGERAGAQLDALAAIALAGQRVATERGIEDASDEERLRLDRGRRAADRQAPAARELAHHVEPAGVQNAAGGGAELALGVGSELEALGGQAAL